MNMDVYRQVYERLDALPKEERLALLMEILPPQELFARTDGMRCLIRAFGLGIFETSALLSEAGIPEDDPRCEVFRELRGGLVDRSIPNELRAIAAREATVCRRAGAIQVWEGGRRGWWVPLAVSSRFEAAVLRLIREFAETRDSLLLRDYEAIRSAARERWRQASEAAYRNMLRLGSTSALGQAGFMARSMATFEARFPSEDDVIRKIRMELVPLERPLPERIERILEDVRAAERRKLEAEAERSMEQKRLLGLERHFKEEQLRQLEEERRARDRILREAIDPQVRQAQEIVAQVQASLVRVAREISTAIADGIAVSPATRRSWAQRLEALAALAPGNVSLEQALEGLRRLSRPDAAAGRTDFASVDRNVQAALRGLERRAAIEMRADLIWQLMKEGRAEEALRRVAGLRETLSDNLSEVEALWEMVMEVGAQNQVLEVAELELQPQA
jgi:hypothetical protein